MPLIGRGLHPIVSSRKQSVTNLLERCIVSLGKQAGRSIRRVSTDLRCGKATATTMPVQETAQVWAAVCALGEERKSVHVPRRERVCLWSCKVERGIH